MYIVAAVFLVFSGAAALTYQVTWVRLLGLSMGSTSASISTVLAAFFLGMALGSYFANRISHNHTNSFNAYIFLELCIGVTGLALLPILLNLDSIMASIPALGGAMTGKFLITMTLLSIPTICMGATFPVMAAILIRKESEIGLRIGQLYSLNTFGAIFGALFTGFLFIPNYGLDGAIYIAVTFNLLIALFGWILNKKIHLPKLEFKPHEKETEEITPSHMRGNQRIALIILIGTGFASIASEIGWTKYLSIFTGTTIYGFAAILGIFLMGIAAGSWAIKNYLEQINEPRKLLAYSLLAAGLGLIYARVGLSFVPNWYEGINHLSFTGEAKQWLKYLLVFIIIFPPTFIFGAIFPLNIKLYCGDLNGVQARVGKAYAANTIASIGGSIFAGFWIIPHYGTDVLLVLMCALVLLLPIPLVLYNKQQTKHFAVITLAALFLFSTQLLPGIDYKKLITSVGYKYDEDAYKGAEPNFLFVKEGKISVISLVTYDDKIAKVQANGLNESLIDMTDPSNALVIESLLAYFPYFIHKNPQSAFVVGFGGGITTRAFTHTEIKSVRVVELEPTVVEAGKTIPDGPVTALNDPRVTIEFNDARNTLLIEDKKYDIIAAQPSHPWLAGASNVFTQEFFELVQSRLNEGGIFSQWINLFRMDVTTLRSLFSAFFSVFPEGVTFANLETGDLMLVGSNEALKLDIQQMDERMNNEKILATFKHFNVFKARDLFWYFGLSRAEALQAAGNMTPNTDTNIFSEVRLSALYDNPVGDEDPYTFLHDNFKFDAIPYLDPSLAKEQLDDIGMYFLQWETPAVTLKIAQQLYKLDQEWGRSLKHKIYFWRFDWAGGTEWYDSHQKWRNSTHLNQLEMYLTQKQSSKAEEVIQRIPDEKTRLTAHAMKLFYDKQWQKLAAIKPQSTAEKEWQLLGLAKQDIKTAGQALVNIVDKDTRNLPSIRSLIQYYAAIDDSINMDKWSKNLNSIQQDLVQRYEKLTHIALEEENFEWNKALIDEIARINPESKKLSQLNITRDKALLSASQ